MSVSFFHLRCVPETGSTNDDVRRAAEAGEAEGFALQALRQTGGKGRQGRAWVSPEGNLYVSVLLRPACSPQEAGLYSFVAALAVYDTAAWAMEGDDGLALKWPNDVLYKNQKISGILLEAGAVEGGKVPWLVVGTGLNIAFYPENSAYPATSLTHMGAKCLDLGLMTQKYLENIEKWRLTLVSRGFETLRQSWTARARTGEVVARMPQETVTGMFVRLDDMGRLVLQLADGREHAISAADVFFN
jgi:BirA family biotin operon repressor/biotin-[acetyl-CoA-carboxylase] ligase